MSKKSEYAIDQENWCRLNCYMQSPGATFAEKLENARLLAAFVLGGKPAEVVSIDGVVARAGIEPAISGV